MIEVYAIKENAPKAFYIMRHVDNIVPYWVLHGAIPIDEISASNEIVLAIFFEKDAISKDDIQKSLDCKIIDYNITPEQRELIENCAAIKAVNICITSSNIELFGDALLNKHPEFRNQSSVALAIISAALAERKETFTEEDYNYDAS